jgi:hypothetical protein
MSDDWPLVIDGDEFSPVPETWIAHGHDDGDHGPRLYAASVAVFGRQMLRVRYLHPRQPQVLEATMRGADGPEGGTVPAMLASKRTWPRSITPRGRDPVDVARDAEVAHLREVWGERVEAIPAPDEPVIADGGRAVQALGDPLQTHLGGGRRE